MESRRKSGQKKLKKEKCEICGFNETISALHIHHIIPRCDPRCTNNNNNLCVICTVCHSKVHADPPELTIVGVYMSTIGRLVKSYEGSEPPVDFLPREYWHIKPEDNLLVTNKRKHE